MSRNSGARDYYSSNSRGSQQNNRDANANLPSIHDALGDVLSQPAWPEADSRSRSRDSMGNYRGEHATQDRNVSPRSQANLGSHGYHRGLSIPSDQASRNVVRSRGDPPVPQPSNYTYAVLRPTPGGELIEENESGSRRTRDGPKRYSCDECGERYDRPSTLKAHKLKHSGEKPFCCGHRGCDKRFASKSNMRRHEHSHGVPSAFELVEEEQEEHSASGSSYLLPQTAGESSTNGYATSSKQSSQYYSSSRRK